MTERTESVGPQTNAAGLPARVRFFHAFDEALVDEAMLEFVEADAHVFLAVWARLAFEAHRPVAVHPLEVHGVDRVFLTLQPVARNRRKDDLHEPVLPQERLVVRHQRRGPRAEIGPHHAALRFHRIRIDADFVAKVRFGVGDVFKRLLEAASGFVEMPAMVIAPDAALLDEAVRQIGAAMRTVPVDESVGAGHVAVEHEILAHQADRLDRVAVELVLGGDRHPVAAQ